MKPARQWIQELAGEILPPGIELLEGREGYPTLRVDKVFLHSRYRPIEEARRLIKSAKLARERPVLVVGAGLGYHVAELAKEHSDVAVVEPNRAIAKLALEGPLAGSDVLLGVGDAESIAASPAFKAFAARSPQVLIHPPTARIEPAFANAIVVHLSKASLGDERLSIAVVGPMYGGSLPIAGYLEKAFRAMGHRTCFVDNSGAWELYSQATKGISTKSASAQLGAMLSNFMSEWTYARVMEFIPDICIVLAQAPVSRQFPFRLAKENIVSAFWFVENWRHFPYWRDIATDYDYFFHLQPGAFEEKLEELGCRRHAFVQTACDPDVHRPVDLNDAEAAEFGCDASFAGAGYLNRQRTFSGLTDYDLKLWGVDWHAPELQDSVCRPDQRFTADAFAKIVAGSKINLNLHASAVHEGVDPACDTINPRVFEIAACGGFQLCDPCTGIEVLFDPENELPLYQDLAELRKKIDHFLANPDERTAIAAAARERALAEHTYEHRAEQMLGLILESYGARILRKGIRVQRTNAEMADRVGAGTALGDYLASLPADTLFTYENAMQNLRPLGAGLSYPEQVFTFLREVRDSVETLLERQ